MQAAGDRHETSSTPPKALAANWASEDFPCEAFPAVSEILGYQLDENQVSRFLRPPQIEALNIYRDLRTRLNTPRIIALYNSAFPSKKDLLGALGLNTPGITDFLLEHGSNFDARWARAPPVSYSCRGRPTSVLLPAPMSEPPLPDIRAQLDAVYRTEGGRILATLIRLLGDFDRAEDAMHDAFAVALRRWPAEGVPANPRAWLISAGRFKAIDALRRRARLDAAQTVIAESAHGGAPGAAGNDDELPDDRLKLIFTCCHPVLAPDARAALTLREVCGLTTEEIARAFLTSAPTIAQRIVRAKAKIREERLPYQVPSAAELPERIGAVLAVVYLLFNEGYSASSGPSLTRGELSAEAIRLGRVMAELMPEPEVMGLLALMLLHESRRAARVGADGELVLLEQQNRSLWNQVFMREGIALVERSLATRRFGPYTLQAAIAAVHAEAPTAEATDWRQICALYTALLALQPSPVIELNRAAAVAMHEGPAAGLALIEALLARGELRDYPLAHAARADLYRRLGRRDEARAAYAQARALAQSEPEQRYLEKRLRELG